MSLVHSYLTLENLGTTEEAWNQSIHKNLRIVKHTLTTNHITSRPSRGRRGVELEVL